MEASSANLKVAISGSMPKKTSPFQFYQFWLNAADADAENWIKIFTFLQQEEIKSLIEEHRKDAGQRILQKRLAKELTIYVHSEEEYNKAIETTEKLFAKQNASADELTADDLEGMEGIVKIHYPAGSLQAGADVLNFLVETQIFPSKGEARKMIQNGGVSLNREKITDMQMQVSKTHLLHEKYLLIQKGKKHYFLVIAAN